ncbi:MAG: M48 family metallopeptidase [Patescibacteria group bacterium]
MWVYYRRRRKRASTVTKHYLEHKEAARSLVLARLEHFNQFYDFTYKRVAIRNQRRCWGSCSELGNLNFSYKLLFLPEPLADYIILHELCHLKELNHGPNFWALIEEVMPDYRERIKQLRHIERTVGTAPANLEKQKVAYAAQLTEIT